MTLDRILILGACFASIFAGLGVILIATCLGRLQSRLRGLAARQDINAIKQGRPV